MGREADEDVDGQWKNANVGMLDAWERASVSESGLDLRAARIQSQVLEHTGDDSGGKGWMGLGGRHLSGMWRRAISQGWPDDNPDIERAGSNSELVRSRSDFRSRDLASSPDSQRARSSPGRSPSRLGSDREVWGEDSRTSSPGGSSKLASPKEDKACTLGAGGESCGRIKPFIRKSPLGSTPHEEESRSYSGQTGKEGLGHADVQDVFAQYRKSISTDSHTSPAHTRAPLIDDRSDSESASPLSREWMVSPSGSEGRHPTPLRHQGKLI